MNPFSRHHAPHHQASWPERLDTNQAGEIQRVTCSWTAATTMANLGIGWPRKPLQPHPPDQAAGNGDNQMTFGAVNQDGQHFKRRGRHSNYRRGRVLSDMLFLTATAPSHCRPAVLFHPLVPFPDDARCHRTYHEWRYWWATAQPSSGTGALPHFITTMPAHRWVVRTTRCGRLWHYHPDTPRTQRAPPR